MTFGGFEDHKHQRPMADINVTPMVDVMLVLVVIFILTAPLFTHAVRIDLPNAQSAAAPGNAETIILSIDAAGSVFWNGEKMPQQDLPAKMTEIAKKNPQTELHLRADKSTRYEVIAQVMATAQSAGLTRIGFVTEPKPGAPGFSPNR